MTTQEKRKHPRVPMMVKVEEPGTGQEMQFFSREASQSGIFLETPNPFAVGTFLKLKFQIPGTTQETRVTAKVMRVMSGPDKKNSGGGMGLLFVEIDEKSKQAMADYVEKLEKIRRKLQR